MDQQQALTVLVQAAQVAQSKGAFSLQEAGVVAQAVAAFTPQEPPQVESPQESASETDVEEEVNGGSD